MTPGPREHNGASLNIRESDVVRPELRAGLRELTDLYVAHEQREQGRASELLRQVLAEADAHGTTLLLVAHGDGSVSDDDLAGWYRRFGFRYLQFTPHILMMRPPRGLNGSHH